MVHVIREHIAEREDRPEASVTTDDIFDRVRYFGITREETAAGEILAAELNTLFPRKKRRPVAANPSDDALSRWGG